LTYMSLAAYQYSAAGLTVGPYKYLSRYDGSSMVDGFGSSVFVE
jgi:hypothetical protein